MRKLKVVFLVMRNVRNWLPLLLARAGLGSFPPRILLRNGLVIAMPATEGGGWGEVFEPLIADVYRSPSGFRGLIVDIGANAGAFTLLAAWRNPDAAVFAFEPQAKVLEILREILPSNLQVVAEYHPWCPVPLAESLVRMQRAGFACSTEEAFQETYFRAMRGDPKAFSVRA